MRRTAALLGLAGILLCPLAARAGGPDSWSYLSRPTDQLIVPGQVAGTEVTPEGYLYTGWGELVFRYGPRLLAWDQPVRTLDGGRYPVLSATADSAGVRYSLSELATVVDGQEVNLVRVAMRNLGGTPRVARFAAGLRWSGGDRVRGAAAGLYRYRFPRPVAFTGLGLLWQPGAAFSGDWSYRVEGDTVTRDGQVMLVLPGLAGRGARAQVRGFSGRIPRAGPASLAGEAGQRIRLSPGAAATLVYAMPVQPLAGGAAAPALAPIRAQSFDAVRAGVDGGWRALFTRGIGLDLPERKVSDTFYSGLRTILEGRYVAGGFTVQTVNALQYHFFLLRDGAMMTDALELAGYQAQAAENLRFFAAWQRADGLFISRSGQYDGIGQALWALGEHARRSGDAAWARAQLPAVAAAEAWIARSRAADRYSLLPAGNPRDNEFVAGHLFGDDFWAVAGLDAAAALARVAGEPGSAAAWQAQADDLRAAVRRQVQRVRGRFGGAIPPAVDAAGGFDWGNLWAAWPDAVLAPADPAVSATLRRVRSRFAEGIATFGGARPNLHDYLGFRVFETELERGQQADVVAGLYSTLAHTTATNTGFETAEPYASRAADVNLAPHGWFAAEYVELVRNMLVREDGSALDLMSALPPGWLAPGRHVGVTHAPTLYGPVDVSIDSRSGGATLRWSAPLPAGVTLRWAVPATATAVRVDGRAVRGRWVTLAPGAGRARIGWRLRSGRTPSFAATAQALARAYRARGQIAPSGSVGG
jgi:hypothetical protein